MSLRQRIHIDAATGVGAAVDRFGKDADEFGLAYAGRPEKQGNMQGAARIADVGLDQVEYTLDLGQGRFLPDDAGMQPLQIPAGEN
jgi:hypothetical protein